MNLDKNILSRSSKMFPKKDHKEQINPHVEIGKSKTHLTHPNPMSKSKQRYTPSYNGLVGSDEIESVSMGKCLLKSVIIVRTNNGTEFKNLVLKEYFDSVGISHQASSVRTPQQNGVVEQRNRTLVEAARTMLIFFLINGKKPDISFLHVFGALCYPKNDREDIGKLGTKGDIGFFIGYSATSCAYKFYNRRTKEILETMNVTFDKIFSYGFYTAVFKNPTQTMKLSRQISSRLDLTYALSTITSQKPTERELDLLFEVMYDNCIGSQPSAATRTTSAAQEPQDVDELEPEQQHAEKQDDQAQLQYEIVADNVLNVMLDGNTFVNLFAPPSTSVVDSSSLQYVDPSNMHTFYQPYPHEYQWTKDHPLEKVIEEPT
ncbi:retrovirus-related pol polyprotein from transposon TNT 1-94 [Tanacetum coccineum]|uniref:Retrovirus-related pol polyprotein from transposon TNT 1-94 n=1 Tax=Tanacetum coccineum TaxID=301880 RepID=A0ABQ5CW44_9ASTR